MPDIWAIIVLIIIFMIFYGYISSEIKAKKKRKLRKGTIPSIIDNLKVGYKYNVVLSDGKIFDNVEIVGSVESDDAAFSFADYHGMLVIKKENEKKIYIKKSCIRFVEEN